jgi:hypothetical protein
LRRLPRTTDWRSASQLARAAGAIIGKRLVAEPIEPARLGVTLDLLVEARRLEFVEPSAELGELML